VANELAAAVASGVPDARPEILCAKPEIVRTIDLDGKTGAAKK
jgi:hypothetical protein